MSRGQIPPIGPNPFFGNQTGKLNRAIRAINDISSVAGDSYFQRGPLGSTIENSAMYQPPLEFYGVVVSSGPSGEADFQDSRYWIQSVDIAQTAFAGITDSASAYVLTQTYWLSATNLAEVVAGTHNLPTVTAFTPSSLATATITNGTIVRVTQMDVGKLTSATQDLSKQADFGNTIFVCEPLSFSKAIKFKITGAAAGGGKYVGRSVSGSSNAVATGNLLMPEGLTVASSDNLLILNEAENGSSVHSISTSGTVFGEGEIVGTGTDGKMIVVSSIATGNTSSNTNLVSGGEAGGGGTVLTTSYQTVGGVGGTAQAQLTAGNKYLLIGVIHTWGNWNIPAGVTTTLTVSGQFWNDTAGTSLHEFQAGAVVQSTASGLATAVIQKDDIQLIPIIGMYNTIGPMAADATIYLQAKLGSFSASATFNCTALAGCISAVQIP